LSKELHRAPRIVIEDDIPGSITVVEPMRVAQISRTGAQIDTTASLPVGTLHDRRVTFEARAVVVKGQVAHSSVRHVHRDQVFY